MAAPRWRMDQFRMLEWPQCRTRTSWHKHCQVPDDPCVKGVCVHHLTYEESGRTPYSYSPCDGNHERDY